MSTPQTVNTAAARPPRPWRVALAGILLTLLAVLIGLAGCLALITLALWGYLYWAAGGAPPPGLVAVGAYGFVAIALSIVGLRAAMLVLRGDRRGRRVALALAVASLAYGAVTVAVTNAEAPMNVPLAYVGLMGANLALLVTLLSATAWFDAVEASSSPG